MPSPTQGEPIPISSEARVSQLPSPGLNLGQVDEAYQGMRTALTNLSSSERHLKSPAELKVKAEGADLTLKDEEGKEFVGLLNEERFDAVKAKGNIDSCEQVYEETGNEFKTEEQAKSQGGLVVEPDGGFHGRFYKKTKVGPSGEILNEPIVVEDTIEPHISKAIRGLRRSAADGDETSQNTYNTLRDGNAVTVTYTSLENGSPQETTVTLKEFDQRMEAEAAKLWMAAHPEISYADALHKFPQIAHAYRIKAENKNGENARYSFRHLEGQAPPDGEDDQPPERDPAKELEFQNEIMDGVEQFGVKAFLAIATDPEIRKELEKPLPRNKVRLLERLTWWGDKEKEKIKGEIDWESKDLQEILKRDPHSAAGRIGILLTELHRLRSKKPDKVDSAQQLQTGQMLTTAALQGELSKLNLENLDTDGSLAKDFEELSQKSQKPLSEYSDQIISIMRKSVEEFFGRPLKPDEFDIKSEEAFPLLLAAARFADAVTYVGGRPTLTDKAQRIIKGMVKRGEISSGALGNITYLSEFATGILKEHYRFDTETLMSKNYANLYADKIVNTVNSIRGQGNEIEPNLREVIKNLVIMGLENDRNGRNLALLKTIAQMVGLSIFPHLDKLFNEGLYGDETPQPQR